MTLHIALVHFPTVDKQGAVAATSITNLDIHDLARAGRTYGVDGLWILHPYPAMHRYTEKVLRHWLEGWGGSYNPTRREALAFAHLASDLGEMATKLEVMYPGREIVWVATSARMQRNRLTYARMREWLADPNDQRVFCLLFGTGSGLHTCVMEEMDYVLEPIYGPTDWNHLSVRAAAGIIMDRLLGLGRSVI